MDWCEQSNPVAFAAQLNLPTMTTRTKPTFRETMLQAREDAILDAVNRLLATKGFELMTVDEVVADVGIAKASLYKHFDSKEELAAAAMQRVLATAQSVAADLDADPSLSPLDKLKGVTRWAMQTQLAGQMPSLPSHNQTLRAALGAHKGYTDSLFGLSEQLEQWIEAALADGSLRSSLPPTLMLYTVFARACDPVLGFLRGSLPDAELVEAVLDATFHGLAHPSKVGS